MKLVRTRYAGLLACWAAMAASAFAAGPMVVVVGPPGSGRSTQAAILKKDLGMAVIAADDLIARNPQKFQKYKQPTMQGVETHLDPALNALVEEALRTTDLSKGVVLDGFPASKTQGDFLTGLREKLELPPAMVIHLSVPDDVVRKRLKGTKRPNLEQEIKDYHREFDFVSTYFPEADLRTVDGTKKVDQVAKEIRKMLKAKKD